MKKLLAFLLAAMLLLTLCACNEKDDAADITPETETAKITETTEALAPPSYWTLLSATDDFGSVSYDEQLMLFAPIEGTFSNTATESSELSGNIYISTIAKGSSTIAVFFELNEFGDHRIAFAEADENQIVLKTNADGLAEEWKLLGYADTGLLELPGAFSEDQKEGNYFYNKLVDGVDIPCVITVGSSTYEFTVESRDIKEVYNNTPTYASADEIDASVVSQLVSAADVSNPIKLFSDKLSAYSDRFTLENVLYSGNAYFVKMLDQEGNNGYLLQDKIALVYNIDVVFKDQSDIDTLGTDKLTYYGIVYYNGIHEMQNVQKLCPETLMLFNAGEGTYVKDEALIDEAVEYQFTVRSTDGYNDYYGTNIHYEVSKFAE